MKKEESYNPYCPVCNGCGEDGCCSAFNCQQSPDGSYCSTYLKDLKFGYYMHNLISKKIYDNEEKYKELIEYIENEFDKAYDRIYK